MSIEAIPVVSKEKRMFIRAAAYLYLPLIVGLLIFKDKYFPQAEEWIEIVFCVLIPVLTFVIPYLTVTRKKCPKCKKAFFKSNPFSTKFGTDVECKKCGYPKKG